MNIERKKNVHSCIDRTRTHSDRRASASRLVSHRQSEKQTEARCEIFIIITKCASSYNEQMRSIIISSFEPDSQYLLKFIFTLCVRVCVSYYFGAVGHAHNTLAKNCASSNDSMSYGRETNSIFAFYIYKRAIYSLLLLINYVFSIHTENPLISSLVYFLFLC